MFLSSIELCCGVPTQEDWCITPLLLKKEKRKRKKKKVRHDKLQAIVISDSLDLETKLCLNHGIERNKERSNVSFGSHEIDPCVMRALIYYNEKIFETI